MNGIKLRGTGRCVPANTVTNDDLSRLVDTNDEWITARTGIHAMVAENAIQCVAEGTGKSLESIQDMQDGTMNLSRRKQIN